MTILANFFNPLQDQKLGQTQLTFPANPIQQPLGQFLLAQNISKETQPINNTYNKI